MTAAPARGRWPSGTLFQGLAALLLLAAAGCTSEEASVSITDPGPFAVQDGGEGIPDGLSGLGDTFKDRDQGDDPSVPDGKEGDGGAAPEDPAGVDLPPSPDGAPSTDPGGPCVEELYCDDGDPCTHSDKCNEGECEGEPYECFDGRHCTDDVCDGYGGCDYPVKAEFCLIHNVCYAEGAGAFFNSCIVCKPSFSAYAFVVADDGMACGGEDPCLEEGTCAMGQCSGTPTGCDDQNPCTDDKCDAQEGCVYSPNFEPCEDGDPCTLGDQCDGGECRTGAMPADCDDGDQCTIDICTSAGCSNEVADLPCDDGNACTENDLCEGGDCVPGETISCNDGNDCTADTCDPVRLCQHELMDNPCCKEGQHICNDNNLCTVDDCDPGQECAPEDEGCVAREPSCSNTPVEGRECNDGDACTFPDLCDATGLCTGSAGECDDNNDCTTDSCDPRSGCTYTPTSGACDDHNMCTKNDTCRPGGKCRGTSISCNDDNPCTRDTCKAAEGCLHEAKTGSCNDSDICTTSDRCEDGTCKGKPRNCDDGNSCTADTCHPAVGCQSSQIAGPCDDGNECTENDHCVAGSCVGIPVGLCCTPEFNDPAHHITSFALGEDGHEGSALDVDGNAGTCSPPGKCSGGRDNSLAPLSGIANAELGKVIADGGLHAIFEERGFNRAGVLFDMAIWEGKEVDRNCDFMNPGCSYRVPAELLDEDCNPRFVIKDARVAGDKITAGGVGSSYPFEIPITPDTVLPVTLANARIEATITWGGPGGDEPIILDGILAGAVPKATIVDAVKNLPDEELPPEISKQTILTLLNLVIKNDIDTSGDGNKDAASIGIKFKAVAADIVGVRD